MANTTQHKILIAEDDFVVGKNLTLTLTEHGYEVIDVVDSGEELLTRLKDEKPDLIIMDINLAGFLDGITVAWQVNEKLNIPVLYLTSDRDRATLEKAKLTHPAGYLIKPFDTDELVSAIELAIYNHGSQKSALSAETDDAMISDTHLFVKSKNRLEKVRFDDILFIEANDIYASLHTSGQSYVLSYPLKAIAEKFPGETFMRVHRSYMVNLDKIDAIEDNYILIGQKNIPIGKTHKAELMRRLSII